MYKRVLIIGMGSAGKRHKAICESFGCEVTTYDLRQELWAGNGLRAWSRPAPHGYEGVVVDHGLEIDWSWPEAVFICTPPDSHWSWVKHCGRLPTFIEKPLGLPSQIEQWEEQLASAEAPVAVGYQLRYHAQYQALKAKMPEYGDDWVSAWLTYSHDLRKWRPEQDYRKGYICKPRGQGGGIIMDASHELDMALWLFGKPRSIEAYAYEPTIEGMAAEDKTSILMRYPGAHLRVNLDGIMPEKRRGALVVFPDGRWETADGTEGMQAAYEAQDLAFLEGQEPLSSGWSALETLRLIGQCHKAIGG